MIFCHELSFILNVSWVGIYNSQTNKYIYSNIIFTGPQFAIKTAVAVKTVPQTWVKIRGLERIITLFE